MFHVFRYLCTFYMESLLYAGKVREYYRLQFIFEACLRDYQRNIVDPDFKRHCLILSNIVVHISAIIFSTVTLKLCFHNQFDSYCLY